MRYFTHSFNVNQPTTALFQPSLLRDNPDIVEIGDFWGRCGAGIGSGTFAGLSGLGEYYERRHFFSEVASHRKAVLEDTLEDHETSFFKSALLQTMVTSKNSASLMAHDFQKTTVIRLKDFSPCEIPTVCLSISPANLDPDNQFHPVRDTCGCSFHWNLENAIFGALKESIERQFLLRFWLTAEPAKKLDLANCISILEKSGCLTLFNALTSFGDITALEITDLGFPGTCIIVIYGSDVPEHQVHYCAGMAYSDSLEKALEKAVYELWQTFRFIKKFHLFNNEISKIKDPYLRHFLSCNKYSTYLEIVDMSPKAISQAERKAALLNIHTLREAVLQADLDGYLYILPTRVSQRTHFFCKYISPKTFMHMNNASFNNIINNYSKRFRSKINTTRQQTMVPFP